jgi:CO/xanthine dehydrogenase Mo-binding subunit
LEFEDFLHAIVLRSPYPHAIIQSIDARKAERIEGVKAIVTWPAHPGWRFGHPPINFLNRKVRYVGDAAAVMAAESEKIADAARSERSSKDELKKCGLSRIVPSFGSAASG